MSVRASGLEAQDYFMLPQWQGKTENGFYSMSKNLESGIHSTLPKLLTCMNES